MPKKPEPRSSVKGMDEYSRISCWTKEAQERWEADELELAHVASQIAIAEALKAIMIRMDG